MPRLINLEDQKNLWGATTNGGLEPQRSDLWLVDLTDLVNGLNKQGVFEALGLAAVPKFYTQFVHSVTFPELKLKPDVYRRDSVPFNMPVWDEPLDPVKISFVLDTWPNANQSMVLAVMQAWQGIVRAGRGDRSSLYGSLKFGDVGWVPLNVNFRYDYTFPIRIAQLRGSSSEPDLSAEQVQRVNQQMLAALQPATGATADVETAFTLAQIAPKAFTFPLGVKGRPLTEQPWLQVAANWILKDCWLGGWKMSDVSYGESRLVTVDATIYAEDLYQMPIS